VDFFRDLILGGKPKTVKKPKLKPLFHSAIE